MDNRRPMRRSHDPPKKLCLRLRTGRVGGLKISVGLSAEPRACLSQLRVLLLRCPAPLSSDSVVPYRWQGRSYLVFLDGPTRRRCNQSSGPAYLDELPSLEKGYDA